MCIHQTKGWFLSQGKKQGWSWLLSVSYNSERWNIWNFHFYNFSCNIVSSLLTVGSNSLVNVMALFSFLVNEISDHLGTSLLGTPIGYYLDCISCDGQSTYSGLYYILAWGFELNIKDKVRWVPVFFLLCYFTENAVWLAATKSYQCHFSAIMFYCHDGLDFKL